MNIKLLVLCTLSVFLSACINATTENNLVGIYKVTSSDCKGNEYEKLSCNDIELLEIVKGSFYKIEDHEYAFVVWSGNIELNYNARKLNDLTSSVSFPFELPIDNSEGFIESLIFNSSDIGKYEFGKPQALSTISFKKAKPEEVSKYRIEYPGND